MKKTKNLITRYCLVQTFQRKSRHQGWGPDTFHQMHKRLKWRALARDGFIFRSDPEMEQKSAFSWSFSETTGFEGRGIVQQISLVAKLLKYT